MSMSGMGLSPVHARTFWAQLLWIATRCLSAGGSWVTDGCGLAVGVGVGDGDIVGEGEGDGAGSVAVQPPIPPAAHSAEWARTNLDASWR